MNTKQNLKTLAGIDVGAKGALALQTKDDVIVIDYDIQQYKELLKEHNPNLVAIERVHAMPNQGVVSMFSFGQRLGELCGLCLGLGISYILVEPKDWQKALFLPPRSDKHKIAECINKLYPSINLYGKKGGLRDGRSDALGLLYYACLVEKGTK